MSIDISASDREYGALPAARLVDYLAMAQRRWRLVALISLIGLACGFAYGLLSPHTYRSAGTLMPPEKEQGGAAKFASLLQSGDFDLGSLESGGSGGGVFREVIERRKLADSIISRLDLIALLDLSENHDLAVEQVQNAFDVNVRKSGVIEIGFTTQTSGMPSDEEIARAKENASLVVNEAMVLLDVFNLEKNNTRARSSREFLERMVAIKRTELDDAMTRLAAFQSENKAIALDAQIEASVGALAELRTQKATLELEKSRLTQDLNPNASAVEAIDRQIAEVTRQLAKSSARDVLGMNLSSAPDLSRQFALRKLDVEVATQVYGFLESQFHSEQIAEYRDLATVSVLDEARIPLYRSAPRRFFALILGGGLAFFFALLLVVVLELFGDDWREFRADSKQSRRGDRSPDPGKASGSSR